MQLKESGEMYLETIYVLSKKSNYIRSIDVCEEMGYSKPSVSRAVGLLKEGGYLKVGDDGSLILTDLGREIAEKTYERHTVLSKLFVMLGVNPETAAAEPAAETPSGTEAATTPSPAAAAQRST